MALLKALVITTKTSQIGEVRHSSFTHFLDLIDACGFDLKVCAKAIDLEDLTTFNLIFIDASVFSYTEMFDHKLFQSAYKNKIVIFSATANHDIFETAALRNGVRGVFYESDKLELMIKGIQAIKNGKLWFKRDTLEVMVKQLIGDLGPQRKFNNVTSTLSDVSLTKREKMIVNLIAQGAKNVEVAEQLHISINTVKTHVYSIFRKTNCRNRVELIKWSLDDKAVLS